MLSAPALKALALFDVYGYLALTIPAVQPEMLRRGSCIELEQVAIPFAFWANKISSARYL